VLGLRFYACEACDAVHAGPTEPPWCGRCRGGSLVEITHELQEDAYFSPSAADDARPSGNDDVRPPANDEA
jgi:hypothetical protein